RRVMELEVLDYVIDVDAVVGDTWLADRCAVAPLAGLTPAARIAAGTVLGQEAARRAQKLSPPNQPVAGRATSERWLPMASRYAGLPTIALPEFNLPNFGPWNVVVLGGGTGGAPAGIAAARQGARTLVCEAAPGLGGVGTQGMIGSYWHGNRVGFTAEIDRGTFAMGTGGPAADSGKWNVEWKAMWYLRQLRAARADVWFGVRGAGCTCDGNRVNAVIVTTPWGPGVVSCGAAVDATGAATIPAAAGAPCTSQGAQQVAVQGSGLSPRELGEAYRNSDWTFIDDTDPTDVTRAYAAARKKFTGEFDVAQILDTRERRQIIAELDLDPLDFLAARTFPDTVVTAPSNFDSHGFTIHPVFMVEPPDKSSLWAHVPLRSLLPRGLEGVLVTGLGMGCHRDALPVVRMQPDVQNAGYAAGICAAWAAQRHGGRIRELDVRAVQRELVRIGSLDAAVLQHGDSFPITDALIATAAAGELNDHRSLAIVFSDPARSMPLLRQRRDLRAAQILGLLGEAAGASALIAAVDANDWDEGWNYTGMGQFGRSLSPMDVLIIALGRTGDSTAVAAVQRKIERLTGEHAFSHVRAVSIAASCLGARALAPVLSQFLSLSGVSGHHRGTIAAATVPTDNSLTTTSDRNHALRELIAARGLWHCGDHDGVAERILRAYVNDQRGHFARHAQAILATTAAPQERAWRLAMA
ncbi:MAG: FAD-dependent oxidoreductase, partial [Planctomycetota bacterium]